MNPSHCRCWSVSVKSLSGYTRCFCPRSLASTEFSLNLEPPHPLRGCSEPLRLGLTWLSLLWHWRQKNWRILYDSPSLSRWLIWFPPDRQTLILTRVIWIALSVTRSLFMSSFVLSLLCTPQLCPCAFPCEKEGIKTCPHDHFIQWTIFISCYWLLFVFCVPAACMEMTINPIFMPVSFFSKTHHANFGPKKNWVRIKLSKLSLALRALNPLEKTGWEN